MVTDGGFFSLEKKKVEHDDKVFIPKGKWYYPAKKVMRDQKGF
jgi:hypothetical protein